MSQFVPEAFQNTTPAVAPPSSATGYGTLGSVIAKFLADPISNLPPEFTKWLEDFQALNIPQIPISQIVGFTGFVGKFNKVTTAVSESTGSTAYVDLATPGPMLTGLADGTYFFLYGAEVFDSPGFSAELTLSMNSGTPAPGDLATAASGIALGFTTATLKNNNDNSVRMVYATSGGGTASFNRRALFGLRLANV